MRTGRPTPPLTLTDDERERWNDGSDGPTTARALAQRARAILGCAAGKTNTRVARELHRTNQTVGSGGRAF
jgi:DNA-binding NarL/FixJ family response regulator